MLLFDGPTLLLPSGQARHTRKNCQGAWFTGSVSAREAWVLFKEKFGVVPEILVSAPARVNLIGEHTDYSGGWVFPVAIDRYLSIAASRSIGFSEVVSAEIGPGDPFLTGDLGDSSATGWSRYVAGMAWALSKVVPEPLSNLTAVVQSDIPIGTGISSSAALEVGFGVVWNVRDELSLDMRQIAQLGQRCENDFVGMRCGIMDQMASALGKDGCAMLLDTQTLEVKYAHIPEELRIVVCDTNRPHSHTESGYNDRRTECEEAMAVLGVATLRDTTIGDLNGKKDALGDLLYRRARHIVTENERCKKFALALEESDLQRVGDLMRESHSSLQHDYEVSSPELDVMAESAWDSPGCVGARMTGGGFGGACVALVNRDQVAEFKDTLRSLYLDRTQIEPAFMQCRAVDGARVVEPDGLGLN